MDKIIISIEPIFEKLKRLDHYWMFELISYGKNCNSSDVRKENTFLCRNQRDFKKICNYFDIEHGYDTIISNSKFPKRYPCKMQILKHFEGSMIYFMFKYTDL